jgi:hypothetical protein
MSQSRKELYIKVKGKIERLENIMSKYKYKSYTNLKKKFIQTIISP